MKTVSWQRCGQDGLENVQIGEEELMREIDELEQEERRADDEKSDEACE